MKTELRITHERLVKIISEALKKAGMVSPAAEVEAEVMAEADLLGVPSHGIRMLPGLLKGLRDGRVTASPNPKILRERSATCLLDGDNGPGRFISVQAMGQAMDRAKRCGAGVCLATRLSHWGRAHAYAFRAAEKGLVGICATNAIPNMLAWNSSQPLLGNNPLAIAVPRRKGTEPLVLDMAMSQAAIGKIGTFLREGRKAPANWGLDASGQPSDDPRAILASGKVLPFGDHKGTGLALMLELLTGALAAGLLSFEIGRRDPTGLDPGSSKLFLALDVEAFADRESFEQRVEELLAHLHNAEPGLSVTFPGERGWETKATNLERGVPIHAEIVAQLQAAGITLD